LRQIINEFTYLILTVQHKSATTSYKTGW